MRKAPKSFQDSLVWQKAHQFVLDDLGYGSALELSPRAEEISKLLDAYSRSILTRDS